MNPGKLESKAKENTKKAQTKKFESSTKNGFDKLSTSMKNVWTHGLSICHRCSQLKLNQLIVNLLLPLLVVIYSAVGGMFFYYFEFVKVEVAQRQLNQTVVQCCSKVLDDEEKANLIFGTCFPACDVMRPWTLLGGVVFAFSSITTVGNATLKLVSNGGRIFYIFYCIIGIPLGLIFLGNLGKIIESAITHIVVKTKKWIRTRQKKNQNSTENAVTDVDDGQFEIGGVWFLGLLFCYIALGVVGVMILEEYHLIDGVFISFDAMTAVDATSFFSMRESLIPFSLIYVTGGLAFVTVSLRVINKYLKYVQSLGAKLKGSGKEKIWFSGKQMSVNDLIQTVGKELSIDKEVLNNLDLDKIIENKMEGDEKKDSTTTNDLAQTATVIVHEKNVLAHWKKYKNPKPDQTDKPNIIWERWLKLCRKCYSIKLDKLVVNLVLLLCVLFYMVIGGLLFYHFEHGLTDENSRKMNATIVECSWTILNDRQQGSTLFELCFPLCNAGRPWTLIRGIIFGFTAMTTIGYNALSLLTHEGRTFYVFYCIIGMPLGLVFLANLGKLMEDGVRYIGKKMVRWMKKIKKNKVTPENGPSTIIDIMETMNADDDESFEMGALLFLALFFCYNVVGMLGLSALEKYDLIDGIFINFNAVMAIDASSFFSFRDELAPISLIYVTGGLAFVTVSIRLINKYLKYLQGLGAKIHGAEQEKVWFNGKQMTVKALIHTVAEELDVDPEALNNLDLDRIIDKKLNSDGFVDDGIAIYKWEQKLSEPDPEMGNNTIDEITERAMEQETANISEPNSKNTYEDVEKMNSLTEYFNTKKGLYDFQPDPKLIYGDDFESYLSAPPPASSSN